MKMRIRLLLCIVGTSLFLISCNKDRDDETPFLEGKYRFVKVTSEIPVDYNADGIFETDLTEYFSCKPSLTFQKDGTMKYPSINVVIENITIALGSGNVLEYELAACATPEYNATYSLSGNAINCSTEWGDQLTYQIENNTITSHFNQADLVVQDENGNKILKRVPLTFQFSKN